MFDKKFPWTKVAVSFVLGVAGGAVTALLFAPMTGRKLRRQLEDQVDNVEKLVKKVVNA